MLPVSIHRISFVFLLGIGLFFHAGKTARSFAAPTTKILSAPPITTELTLAKTQSLYMVIDLPNHLATLKARGVLLRTFPLHHVDWIGDPLLKPASFSLTAKDPMITPVAISPPPAIETPVLDKNEDDLTAQPPPPNAQKVSDMPLRYELIFDGKITIIIQSQSLPSFWNNVFQQMANWSGRFSANMATWKEAFGQPAESFLVISMEPQDAQALYWAVFPPMAWLLFPEESSMLH